MSEIANIKLNNVDYGLKDTVARNGVATAMQSITTNINSLENKVKANYSINRPRKFLLFGDSYATRHTDSWMNRMDATFDVVAKNGKGGSGFIANTHSNNNFIDMLTNTLSSLSDAQKLSITDIVVCGGWNDARAIHDGDGTTNDLINRIKLFYNTAVASCPNAIVSIGFIGWQCEGVTIYCTWGELRSVQNIYLGTRYKNLNTLNGPQHVMKSAVMFDNTYFHPNETADLYLYEAISGALFGGYSFKINNGTRDASLALDAVSNDISFTYIYNFQYEGTSKIKLGFKIKNGTVSTGAINNIMTISRKFMFYDCSDSVIATGVCYVRINGVAEAKTCSITINTNRSINILLPAGTFQSDAACVIEFEVMNGYTF